MVYRNTTGKLLTDADIKTRLQYYPKANNFTLDNVAVNAVGMNLYQLPGIFTALLLKQYLKDF